MAVACTRTDCRTSLADDTTVYCPHGLPFCEHCTWEEGCSECAPPVPDLLAALGRSVDQARAVRLQDHTPVEPAVTTCRCGATERQGRTPGPAADLRDAKGEVTERKASGIRWCRACPHASHTGQPVVVHVPSPTSVVAYYYHPECVRL